ncbi:MASE3 domain-containing protein [uncultured Desulfobacter sp.]|uniref:MASE3 domain-containing protein n=1 Tax=uncultured Desulfobacter sp. TaxID=240139 RepID=UPI002AAB4675|nr:MASE3 domain-containing protein [uncultured Desulfobacter sp.]
MAQSIFYIALLVSLYFTTFVNYLLFHTLAEIFSIVVAGSLFMITWNSQKYIKNPYLLFIGVAYFFIAFLDLLHTLSYKGMPIFTDYDYYANQLWIGARYMESITLLLAFFFLNSNRQFKPELLFLIYTIITAFLVASVFVWQSFPVCFIDGSGLTTFKKISEYIICIILVVSMGLLYKNRNIFERKIYNWIMTSMGCTIISELAFTFYISNYGFSNLIGHYFKIFSFYFIYKAIVETGIKEPYKIIFKELNTTIKSLNDEITVRKNLEREKEENITKLKKALEDIKTLNGLIPICSYCKKIRDDKGYWNQLEIYLNEHSEATLSHGICPECLKEHFSDYVE